MNKKAKVTLSDELRNFIEYNGDIVDYNGKRFMHLPQWLCIDESGEIEIGLPEDILPEYVIEQAVNNIKRRFKNKFDE